MNSPTAWMLWIFLFSLFGPWRQCMCSMARGILSRFDAEAAQLDNPPPSVGTSSTEKP